MNFFEVTLLCSLLALFLAATYLGYKVSRISQEWEAFKNQRIELYERLADPTLIEWEMEKSARMREMRDAQRTTLPREGAGPPAKVYRPKMRGAKPGNWRVQRP